MTGSAVAIIDDDRRVLEAIGDLLESAGHKVHAYSSANAFLASESFGHVACVVCDICMPGMDGWGLQRELALRHPAIPLILMTAHANQAAFTSSRCIGRVPKVFRKPFDGAALLQAVEALLHED